VTGEPAQPFGCVLLAVLAAVSGAFWAIVALYAANILGLGPTGFGVLLAVGAAGSLAGSLLAEPLAARLGTAGAIRLAVALITLATAGLAATRSPLVAGTLPGRWGVHRRSGPAGQSVDTRRLSLGERAGADPGS